jgi:hypothetical protein
VNSTKLRRVNLELDVFLNDWHTFTVKQTGVQYNFNQSQAILAKLARERLMTESSEVVMKMPRTKRRDAFARFKFKV